MAAVWTGQAADSAADRVPDMLRDLQAALVKHAGDYRTSVQRHGIRVLEPADPMTSGVASTQIG